MACRWLEVKAVTLSGFGPHWGKVKHNFSDCQCLGGAERAANRPFAWIAAVIFGIPQTTDERIWTSPLRNWEHPPEFSKLIFAVDGDLSNPARFDSNHVSLAKLAGAILNWSEVPIIRGPSAGTAVMKRRSSLFGLSSQDLFEATFV